MFAREQWTLMPLRSVVSRLLSLRSHWRKGKETGATVCGQWMLVGRSGYRAWRHLPQTCRIKGSFWGKGAAWKGKTGAELWFAGRQWRHFQRERSCTEKASQILGAAAVEYFYSRESFEEWQRWSWKEGSLKPWNLWNLSVPRQEVWALSQSNLLIKRTNIVISKYHQINANICILNFL